MRSINQILESAETICDSVNFMHDVCEMIITKQNLDDRIVADLPQFISQTNYLLYHASYIGIQNLTLTDAIDKEHLSDYVGEFKQLLATWECSIAHQLQCGSMDALFWNLYDYFRLVDVETIYNNGIEAVMNRPLNEREFFRRGLAFPWLEGRINDEEKDFSLIRVYANMVKEHAEDFRWLYERLGDNRSKMILLKLANYWFDYDLTWLTGYRETVFADYFDLDIMTCGKDDVFVDCGAYIGDTMLDLVDTYGGQYKKIYAYEIIGETFEKLKKNTAGMINVVYRQAGVSDRKKEMFVDDEIPTGGGSRMAENGRVRVEVVSLDEDISEEIGIIKMDIEGAEMDALKGCRKHILQEKPRLMISAYHRPADIFDIPRLICDMRDDYKLYLRFNGRVAWPADFVIFAV